MERWPIDHLLPYARDARTHSAAQFEQIAASIGEWCWTNLVLVDEAGTIIAAHGRIEAARKLGLSEAPVMVAAGWSGAKRRAYAIRRHFAPGGAGEDLHRPAAGKIVQYGLLTKSPIAGLPLQSPYLAIFNKQAQIMLKAGAELGFFPASRTRVQVAPDIRNNPFARNGVRPFKARPKR